MPKQMPIAYEGDRPYIFVDYAHADREAVLPIIRALVDEGFRVWWDDGIEPMTDYDEYLADHVYGCDCLVMFVSRSTLGSDWCTQEVRYALDLKKKILPVYLENVELTRGLQMRMGHKQALFWYELDPGEFYRKLFKARRLESCLKDEGRLRRGVRPRGGEPNEGDTGIAGAQTAGYAVEPRGTRDGRSDRRDEGLSKQAPPSAGPDLDVTSPQSARPQYVSPPRHNVHVTSAGECVVRTGSETRELCRALEVSKRDKLADYPWDELKRLSQAIAAAGSDEEGLGIAKDYHLVDKDCKLRGDTKEVVLGDKGKTKARVRILGFRHDELAGGGRAGISFEFADVPVTHRMNSEWTNAGGWEKSEMRKWLNSSFLGLLPDDLRSSVAEARKRTNNKGRVAKNDTACVTTTKDRLWLLSMSEVYGMLSERERNAPWSPATYDAEGFQYQLYADKGVSTTSYDSCQKRGAYSWWWLRSPNAAYSVGFHSVYDGGDWRANHADSYLGVSPGFCF